VGRWTTYPITRPATSATAAMAHARLNAQTLCPERLPTKSLSRLENQAAGPMRGSRSEEPS
jgi:hypothetical protein